MNCVFWDKELERYYDIPCYFQNPKTKKLSCDNNPNNTKPKKEVTKDYQYIVLNCPLEQKNKHIICFIDNLKTKKEINNG